MLLLIALAIVLLLCFVFAALRQRDRALEADEPTKTQELAYQKKHYLLTISERSFFEVLRLIVGERFYIFPQVNLDKLVHVAAHTGRYFSYFQRMNKYSVDLVICDKKDLCPLLAIELDDASHNFAKRQERDLKIGVILEEAGLPLLRIPRQNSYTVAEIKSKLESQLGAID